MAKAKKKTTDTSPLALGREQKGSSVSKTKNTNSNKTGSNSKSQSSYSSNTSSSARRSYSYSGSSGSSYSNSRGSSRLSQRIQQRNSVSSIRERRQRREEREAKRRQNMQTAEQMRIARQNQKTYGNVEGKNITLPQRTAEQKAEDRARGQRVKSGIQTAEDERKIRERNEHRIEVAKNTGRASVKGAKDTVSGYGQTLADVDELAKSSEKWTESKAMKLGIDRNDKKRMAEVEKERQGSLKQAREFRQELFDKQEKRQAEFDEQTKDASELEKALYGAAESGTGMLIDTGIGALTGTGQLGALASMGLRTYGPSTMQARKEGATDTEARLYGLAQAGKEMGTELMFQGAGLAKGYAVSKSGKALGLSFADKAAFALTKGLKGKTADVASAGIKVLGGTAEENAEELAGWGLDPLIKEATYGRNVRQRTAESLRANLPEITSKEDADRVAAYFSTDKFESDLTQEYIDSGLSKKEASELAQEMRDYYVAYYSNDEETLNTLEEDLAQKLSGQQKLSKASWSSEELIDTVASTTLLTMATGLPGGISSSIKGNQMFDSEDSFLRQRFGDDAVKVVTDAVKNTSDAEMSAKAQAMDKRLSEGKDLTGTQKYELVQGYMDKVRATSEKAEASNGVVANESRKNDYVATQRINQNGERVFAKETQKAYDKEYESASKTVDELKGSISETEMDRADAVKKAVADLHVGGLTVGDAHEFGYGNKLARETLKKELGIDLDQYVVRTKDGQIDYAATNDATENALFELNAKNAIDMAKVETDVYIDDMKGNIDKDLLSRFGSNAQSVWKDVNQDLDPHRDLKGYLATADAVSFFVSAGRNTDLSVDEIMRRYANVGMNKSVDDSILRQAIEAGRRDRIDANTTGNGQTVEQGKGISLKKTDPITTGELFIEKGLDVPNSEQQVYKALADATNANIHLVSTLSPLDENGNPIIDKITGKPIQLNGMSQGNDIYLNMNASAERNLGYVFMHEMTHQIKQYAPNEYLALENLVRDRWFNKNQKEMQNAIKERINLYSTKGGQSLTEEEAVEEIIADAMAEAMDDPNFASEVCEQNPDLAEQIISAIRSALRSIRQMFAGAKAQNTRFHNGLMSYLGILDDAERMWLDALAVAKQNKANGLIADWQARANRYSLGYHAGDLGKSRVDDYAHQSGSRGTGHFGFGTYFVGDESQINWGDYGKRSHEAVDFDKYNLYKPRNFGQARKLHDALKTIDGLITDYSEFSKYGLLNDETSDERMYKSRGVNKDIDNLTDDYYWEDGYNPERKARIDKFIEEMPEYYRDKIDSELKRLQDRIKNIDDTEEGLREELRQNYYSSEFWQDRYTEEEYINRNLDFELQSRKERKQTPLEQLRYESAIDVIKEYSEDWESERSALTQLADRLMSALGYRHSEEEIVNALKETERIVKGYEESTRGGSRLNAEPGLDSGATVFMKQLGYEGVDVRHIPEMDNTGYGSVIYDLKGEDLARKQEIGTARFSITPEQDAEYMSAVESGDMDKAQQMVDEAARNAGYDTSEKLYHGTDAEFNEFWTGYGQYGEGVYFTYDRNTAEGYAGKGGRVISVYSKPLNVADYDDIEKMYGLDELGAEYWEELQESPDYPENDITNLEYHPETMEALKEAGFNSFVDDGNGGVVIFPTGEGGIDSMVKVADPVTYDDNGDVIPLSERFNTESPNIRYSLSDADYMDAVNRGDMETAQRMVDEAAKSAGYDSHLYSGTDAFGFTEIDTSAPGGDGLTFWASNREDIAGTYTQNSKVRRINSSVDEEEIESRYEEAEKSLDESINLFRRAIDQTFSEWVFGQQDTKVIYDAVMNANPEPGNGDGVYDVLADIVADAWYDYKDEFPEYDEFFEWQDSEQFDLLETTIVAVEEDYATLKSLENGELVGGIYDLYANTDNMYVMDAKGRAWNELRPEGLPKRETAWSKDAPYRTRDVAKWARDNGYDGVIFKNIKDNGQYGRTSAGDVYTFFKPKEQVKSADPVTYDDNGDVIPLSERFNTESPDIRYSLSDADYMDAVNRGDMETAQRMVDEEAERHGFHYRGYHGSNAEFTVFDPEKRGSKNFFATSAYKAFFAAGSLETAESYTGLNSMDIASMHLNEEARNNVLSIYDKYDWDNVKAQNNKDRESFFDRIKYDMGYKEYVEDPIERMRDSFPEEADALGETLRTYWYTKHSNDMFDAWEKSEENKSFKELAEKISKEIEQSEIDRRGYKPHVLNLAIKLENPLVHDYNEEGRDFDDYTDSFSQFLDIAREQGNDGCIFLNVADGADFDTIYTVFDSEQFKSADPVTYDDEGNVIPLSERFNQSNPDIRYSMPSYTQEEMDAHRQALIDAAIDNYGEAWTDEYDESGYVFPNGKMLRMGMYGTRGEDHAMAGIAYDDVGYDNYFSPKAEAQKRFLNEGNFRFMPENNSLEMGTNIEPTYEQYAWIRQATRDGRITEIEFTDTDNNTVDHKDYGDHANAEEVVNDIKRFYRSGEIGGSSLSQFRYSLSEAPSMEELDGSNSILEDKDGNDVAQFTKEGGIKMSISSYDSEGRDIYTKYLNKLVADGELSRQEADEMLSELETIYGITKEFADKKDKKGNPIFAPFTAWSYADVVRDEKGKPVFSAIKKNSEYKMNIDFSTICKKRRTLDAVFREMIKRGMFERLDLNKDESAAMIVNINNLIRQHKFEAACALCFVEARRYRQQQTAKAFTDMWNDLVESMYKDKSKIEYFNFGRDEKASPVPDGIHTMDDSDLDLTHIKKIANAKKNGKPLGTAEAKAARLILSDPSQRKLMRVGDMMASTGFENMQIENPELMKIYNSKKGTGGAKSSFGDVQYLNEMLKSKTFDRMKAYDVSGVRIQSFSDYVPRMVFDYVQVIADLTAKKLPAHAYTKEPLFVKQFGLTGTKINMSLVPDVVKDGIAPGLDADGNYIWNVEGTFPYDEAMELQRAEGYKDNCGTIAVGISDEQMMKMLADPEIQQIIPYHKSSLNPLVAAMTNVDRFTDYTDFQNTKDAEGKAVKKDFNWDRKLFRLSHDAKGNMLPKEQWGDVQALVKEYVKWCEDRNYTPKFSQFLYERKDNKIDGEIIRDSEGNPVINKGYYKLLEDFALLDNDGNFKPQGDVQMRFPTESDAFGSMKDLIEQGLTEDAELEAKRSKDISKIVDEIETMFDEGTLTEQSVTSEKLAERLSIPKEMDEEYMDAVNNEDMEEAQRFVNEAARIAGYGVRAYHGTNSWKDFAVFDINKSGKNWNGLSQFGAGFYFTETEYGAKRWIKGNGSKNRVIGAYLSINNAIDPDKMYGGEIAKEYNRIRREYDPGAVTLFEERGIPFDKEEVEGGLFIEMVNELTGDRFYSTNFLRSLGYDGVIQSKTDKRDGQIVVFDAEQIKSADTVTYREDGSVIPLSERFDPNNDDIRYSMPTQDTEGNILTDGQMEYFKNSQARDSQGKLVPVYHTTKSGGFTIFDPSYSEDRRSIFFTDSLAVSKTYGTEDSSTTYECYLNLENPLIVDADYNAWDRIPMTRQVGNISLTEDYDTNEVSSIAFEEGYDGVIIKNCRDWAVDDSSDFDTIENSPYSTIYIAFSSNQIKDINNENPTENPDIRYSIPDRQEALDTMIAKADSIDIIPLRDTKLEEQRVKYSLSVKDFENMIISGWDEHYRTYGRLLDDESVKPHLISMMSQIMKDSETGRKYKSETLDETVKDMKVMYFEMKNGLSKEFAERAWAAAERIVNDVDYNDDLYVEYKGMRDYLEKRWIQIPEALMYDEDFAEYMRDNSGRMRFRENGSGVEAVYKYLRKKYPRLFPEDLDHPVDMLLQIDYALDLTEPYRDAYSSEEYTDIVKNVAESLCEMVRQGEEYRSVADDLYEKFDARSKAMSQRHNEAKQKIRDQYGEKIASLRQTLAEKRETISDLKAENREALANARQEKKEAVENVRQEEKAKRQRQSDRADKWKEKYKQRIQHDKETRESKKEKKVHRALYDAVLNEYNDLTKRLLNPSKDKKKNIPEQLRQPLAEMLYVFDLEKERSKELEDKYRIPTRTQLNLRQMKDSLEKVIKEDETAYEFSDIHRYLKDKMTEIADKMDMLGDHSIDALDNNDIAVIKDLMKGLNSAIKNYQQFEIDGEKYEAQQIADKVGEGAKEHESLYGKGKKYTGARAFVDNIVNMGELTPIYFFRQIKGMYDMYRQIRKGFDSYVRNEKVIIDKIAKILAPYYKTNRKGQQVQGSEIEDWRHLESAETFKTTYGSLTLTIAQRMSLYCLYKRDQARNHMLSDRGGVVASEITAGSKMHKAEEMLKGKTVEYKQTPLTPEDVENIIATLTPEQMKIADDLQELMSNDMSKLGNQASMKLTGIEMYKEKEYFPIKIQAESKGKDLDNIGMQEKVRNPGFSNPLQEGASNPIILDDIFTVVASHCNEMNLYASYAVPLTSFMKVYNGSVLDENGKAIKVQTIIKETYGEKAIQYIDNFLDDINGNSFKRHGGLDDVLDKALGQAKKASVFANLRVALQQPTAIVRAFAVMNPNYFKGVRPSRKATQEMFEHCPIAQWKSWGYYDTHFGRDIEDVMMGANVSSKMDVIMSDIYGEFDNMTWGMIWQAVKKEVKAENPKVTEGTQEFWDLCSERASYVFDMTQVVDSPFHRSNDMRSKNGLVKQLTSFQAEPTLSFNVLRQGFVDAYEEYKKGNKAKATQALAKVLAVWTTQAVTVAIAQSFVDALRRKGADDDEDPSFLSLWWQNFMKDLVDDLNPINNIYYFKEIVPPIMNALTGEYVFGQQNLTFQWVDTLTKGIQKCKKKWEKGDAYSTSWYDCLTDLFGGIGYLTGVPVKTMMRGLKNALHWFNKITGADVFADDGSVDEAVDNLVDNFRREKTSGEGDGKKSSEEKRSLEADNIEKIKKNASKKAKGYSGSDRDQVLWDVVSDGYTNLISEGRFGDIEARREVFIENGGSAKFFDQKVTDATKKAYKKTMKEEMTADDYMSMVLMEDYLTEHGVSEAELSDIAYHSNKAKDLKAAMRIGNEKYIIDELVPMIVAGLTREDFEKLYKNRNRGANTYTGKYTDPKYTKTTGTFIWPATGVITSHFGYRDSPTAGASSNHPAIDIGASEGTPVVAADGGVVISAGANGGYGNSVGIRHSNGMVTWYNHLYGWNVKVGDQVGQGQQIGQVGSTGISTGPHLDFKIMDADGNPVDPEQYLNKRS